MKPVDRTPIQTSHVHKAMLTFTRDELRALIAALDAVGDRTLREVGARDVLRMRLVFAADSLPPTGGVR